MKRVDICRERSNIATVSPACFWVAKPNFKINDVRNCSLSGGSYHARCVHRVNVLCVWHLFDGSCGNKYRSFHTWTWSAAHTHKNQRRQRERRGFFFCCCCLARVRVIERCVYCVYAITSALSNVTSNSEWHTNAYILFCWRIYSMMRNFLVYILFFSFLACSDWISYETHRPTIQWSTKPIHFLPLTLSMQWNIYIFCPQSDMQSRQVTLRAEPLFELFIFKYVFGSYAWM